MIGTRKKGAFLHRRYHAIMFVNWDFQYRQSLPKFRSDIAALEYIDTNKYTEPTVHFVSERSPIHRVILGSSFAEYNTDRSFLAWYRRPILSLPLFSINQCDAYCMYTKGAELYTFVNQWSTGYEAIYDSTIHNYNILKLDGVLNTDLQWSFLRYFYIRALTIVCIPLITEKGYLRSYLNVFTGSGIRVALWKRIIVDAGCFRYLYSDPELYLPFTKPDVIIRLSVSLIDRGKQN